MAPKTRKRATADNSENVDPSEVKKSKLAEALKNVEETAQPKNLGKIEPDPQFPTAGFHVYIDDDGTVYDATLNQTNLGANNNKFYICQVLKQDGADRYCSWFRWGRVGFNGQNSLSYSSLDGAISAFKRKFKEKTGNAFENRENFVAYPKKYDWIKMDYSKKKLAPVVDGVQEDSNVPSELDERLKSVVDLICNLRAMNTYLRDRLKYDSDKQPLGTISKAQVKAGYELLTQIEAKLLKSELDAEYDDLVNKYLTKIPHAFGTRRVSLLKTIEELKIELELLETLSDVEAANEALESDKSCVKVINPSDRNYERLKCEMIPLDVKDPHYKIVETYLKNTHGATHSSFKMKLLNVFKVERQNEKERFRTDLTNHRLLWHGSGLFNWAGILSQGLRIAPPEAPSTGYMFGKGIYLADSCSKSGNYCRAQVGERGFLMLAQAALGNIQERTSCDYEASKLPKDVHSTQGVGQNEPAKRGSKKIKLDDQEVYVPCGKLTQKKDFDSSLIYNEFIVYDVKQVLLRFLVEVEFVRNE